MLSIRTISRLIFLLWIALQISDVPAAIIEIRTAAQINTEPKFMSSIIDGHETITGLCVDIFRAIEKIDPGVKFVGDQVWEPSARIDVSMLYKIRDAGCGLIKNSDREAHFLILEPALFIFRYTLAARIDDDVTISNWSDVIHLGRDSVVLTLHGQAPSKLLEEVTGLRVDSGSSTIRQNFEKLLAHRGRFVYYRTPGMNYFIQEYCMRDKIKILPNVMDTLALYMLVGKHVVPEIAERLHLAIRKLKDIGELERIQKKWEEYDHDFPAKCPPH